MQYADYLIRKIKRFAKQGEPLPTDVFMACTEVGLNPEAIYDGTKAPQSFFEKEKNVCL